MSRSVKSAERTLALFELFSRRQQPLTVGRISAELAIPQASTSMLLANLRDLGYITYDAHRRTYAPTIRVALLGSWINREFDQAGSLTAILSDLQREVQETVFLGLQNGPYAQYIATILLKKPRGMRVEAGQHKLLTASSVGRMLLSLKSDGEIQRWVHRCNAEATEDRLRIGVSEFMAIIEQIRRQGFTQTRGDVTPEFGAIAVTVPAPRGFMPMALGVGIPVDRIEAKHDMIVEALRHASERLKIITLPQQEPSSRDTILGP
ncbi:IclR family transcriptional regulator [Sphingopyxis granuli]|uniref:IclR family transcriptional regulator n=1 Tax=Sphingopyxis granuli TaxID=267128 RepID=UPI001BAECF5D|nr:helix-turn-helix domain-containing protein [Sphingopyxis granuli]QUM71626.1 helix-turn-helix domain-containing protein [Sphingopyxis granuli]